MTEITPAALSERVQNHDEDILVLDIRPQEEFSEWHIPGSVNVDVYDELTTNPEAAKDPLGTLPEEKAIVTVCAAGILSQTATRVLTELGYEAKTLTDGMAGWSRVHHHAVLEVPIDGTLIQVARPGKGCLSYVLISEGEAVVFDPSQYLDTFERIVDAYGAEVVGVLDTHAHADHISGGADLATRHGVPYYLHQNDALELDVSAIEDGQTVTVGDLDIKVIHTPGHSEGSVTYTIDDAALLTGDTLFHESVGRVELGVEAGIDDSDVEGNAAALYESLQKLLDHPGDAMVLPSHDPGSPEPPVTASLDEVIAQNSDLELERETFVRKLASDIPEQPPNFDRVKRANTGLESIPTAERAQVELGPNNCAAE